jgi:hypothetical protein
MATAVLTNIPTVIDNAEAITNWGGDTFVLDGDIKVQGDNSVSCTFTPNAGNDQEVYVEGNWDFTTAEHLRLWMNNTITAYLETKALDGIQIFVYDGTNADYWTVGGSDDYAGGWKQFLIYTGSTPDEDNGCDHSAITRIGIRMAVHTRPKNAINLWLDAWAYGDGYTVTGGTSGDEIDWSHVAALDKIEAHGIVELLNGVFFFAGEVTTGAGATTTFFKEDGQIVVFKDLPVSSTLYKLIFEGSACNVDLDGGVWAIDGPLAYGIDISDTNLNAFDMDGKQITGAGATTLSPGPSVTNCVFNKCGQIDPSSANFDDNTIKFSTDIDAGVLWNPSINMERCNFVSNIYGSGIEHTLIGEFDYVDLTFSENSYDVSFTGTALVIDAGSFVEDRGYEIYTVGTTDFTLIGAADNNIGTLFVATGIGAGTGTAVEAVVINKTGTSNPSTQRADVGGEFIFVGSVPISITVIDKDTGVGINLAHVHLLKDSDKSELLSGATNSSGIITGSFGGATPVDVVGWARQMDILGDDYEQEDFGGQISENGLSLTIALTKISY